MNNRLLEKSKEILKNLIIQEIYETYLKSESKGLQGVSEGDNC